MSCIPVAANMKAISPVFKAHALILLNPRFLRVQVDGYDGFIYKLVA